MECQEEIIVVNDYFMEIRAELELVVGNNLFMNNGVYKYKWVKMEE